MQWKTIVVGIALLGTYGVAVGGSTPEQKCEAGKNLVAGKDVACRSKAQRKLILTGDARTFAEAVTKCDAKFSLKWQKLERAAADLGTTCPSTGNETAMLAHINLCIGVMDWIAGGGIRFAGNSDGTISDSETGLMWEKKVKLGGGDDYANLHDADNDYRYAALCSIATDKFCQPTAEARAACLDGVEGDPGVACQLCGPGEGTCNPQTIWQWLADLNAAEFAGYDDWRIPTREELESLLILSDNNSPKIDVAFDGPMCGPSCPDLTSAACSCTWASGYWSATASTFMDVWDHGYDVNFHYGEAIFADMDAATYVRAVRGGF